MLQNFAVIQHVLYISLKPYSVGIDFDRLASIHGLASNDVLRGPTFFASSRKSNCFELPTIPLSVQVRGDHSHTHKH